MTTGFRDLPELKVDRLDRICGINDTAQFGRVIQERHEFIPGQLPNIDRPRVFFTPLLVELFQGELCAFQGGCGVDRAHHRGELLAVAVIDETHRITDHVDNARLYNVIREDRPDRIGQSGQAVAAGDENVCHTTVPQISEDLRPELRTLGVLDPAAQGVFAALHVHPNGQVSDLGGDHPGVLDPDPDAVDIDDRIHLVERSGLPGLDLVDNDVRDI